MKKDYFRIVIQLGNSLGITLPKDLVSSIKKGDTVMITPFTKEIILIHLKDSIESHNHTSSIEDKVIIDSLSQLILDFISLLHESSCFLLSSNQTNHKIEKLNTILSQFLDFRKKTIEILNKIDNPK